MKQKISILLALLIVLLSCGYVFAATDDVNEISFTIPEQWELLEKPEGVTTDGVVMITSEDLLFTYERIVLSDPGIYTKDGIREICKALGFNHIYIQDHILNGINYVEAYGDATYGDGTKHDMNMFFHLEENYMYMFTLYDSEYHSQSYSETLGILETLVYDVDSPGKVPANTSPSSSPATNNSNDGGSILVKGIGGILVSAVLVFFASLFKKSDKKQPEPVRSSNVKEDEPITSVSPPEQKVIKICPNCGAEVAQDDIFCGKCGTKL